MKKNLLIVLLLFLSSVASMAQIPDRKGWWKFDDPSDLLKAEIGSPLQSAGNLPSVDGPAAGNKAIELSVGNFLTMNHGIAGNGGGSLVNEYTLQIDFSVSETGIWHSFMQTDDTNANDADLFINTGNSVGVSATGYSAKGVASNYWYRMIVSVKNGESFKIYIDGTLWLDGAIQDVDGRFGLLNTLLLFADNDGEDGTIQCSEVGIWDFALSADDAKSLGGATGARVPERTRQGWWKFDDTKNLLLAEIGKPLQISGSQTSVSGPSAENKATKIEPGSYLKMTSDIMPNGGGAKVNEYSLQIDFSIPQSKTWHSFIQTDQTNASDADLFTNTGDAIGTASLTYSDNTIQADTWYRMVLSVKNGEFFRVYVNGELWLDAPGQEIDGRYALENVLLLFADNDGEDGTILCSELSIWEVALNETEIAELGSNPSILIPERAGWWKFDDPLNLMKGEIGYDLIPTGTNASIPGPVAGNKAIEVASGDYLTMIHGIYGNGDGYMVNEYSLQIDFMIPEAGIWHAFIQTDALNGGDADLFTNTSNSIGTAQTSYTANTISANTWYRMVITVKNGYFFRIYINGELWLDGTGQSVDGRYALADKLLLFADDDGEDGLINCSEIAIWDVPLNPDEVSKLGDATTSVTGISAKSLGGNQSQLGQNYPNPFNSSTVFPYQINKTGQVTFRILDLNGKEIRRIDRGTEAAGKYNLQISSEKLNSGIYFLQMQSDNHTITRKMIINK